MSLSSKQSKNSFEALSVQLPGRNGRVLVMRHNFMGSDSCKNKAKEISAQDTSNTYVGLAVLTASQIRETTSTVHDLRGEFCGHAHISHGIVAPPNEPLEAALRMQLDDRLDALKKAAVYYPDPAPNVATWTGNTLEDELWLYPLFPSL